MHLGPMRGAGRDTQQAMDNSPTVERRFTEPQRKALLWLVPGQACGDAPRAVSAALKSLELYHKDLVKAEWLKTPRGRTYLAFTLTDLGIAARATVA